MHFKTKYGVIFRGVQKWSFLRACKIISITSIFWFSERITKMFGDSFKAEPHLLVVRIVPLMDYQI